MKTRRRITVPFATCAVIALSFALCAAPVEAGRDEWIQIGPLGGTVYSLAVNPANPNVLYAPLGGKLYSTEDGGASWNTKPACPSGVWKVVIDPRNPAVLYAVATGALHKSIDAGDRWNQIATGVGTIALDPNYPERLYIGNYGTVRKSVDGGATWTYISPDPNPWIGALAVSPGDSATIYAGAVGDGDFPGRRIYKTTDGGLTWSYSISGLPYTDISGLLVDPVHPDTIFAVTSGGPMYASYGLYRSMNGGLSWSAANTGLPCTYCRIEDLKAIPGRSGEFCAVVNGKSFWTEDGGDTWNPYSTCVNDVMLTVEFCPADADIRFFGARHGIWKLTPTSCERSGIVPINLSEIAIDASSSGLIAAADIAYISRDGGLTWELSRDGADWGSATAIAINPHNENILYVGGYNGGSGLYRSDDGGMSWNTALADIGVNAVEIDPVSPNIVYVGGLDAPHVGGLFKSVDDGIAWTKIDAGITMSIAVNPIDHNTLYVGTQLEGIKKSTDGGASWDPINNGLPPCVLSSGFILTIAIDPLNAEVLYCGTYCGITSYGVFKSTNAGAEWTAANEGLTTMDIRKIVIDYLRPSILYAQSFGAGVFRSVDGARTWEPMNAGLPSLSLGDLIIDPVSPNVLYCCGASGLFRYESSFNPATDAGSTPSPPLDNIRNFPNPFSNSTTVEYAVTSSTHVRLKVYDVAGRCVKTLVDTRLGPGRYRANLRANGLSAGVYFIEGTFGNRTITRKCILIK